MSVVGDERTLGERLITSEFDPLRTSRNLSSSRLSFESEGTTRFEGIVGAAAALGNSVG